jgi:hypothetical protein
VRWGTNVVQWNNVSSSNSISSNHTFQNVQASSTISCTRRWRRGSGVEALNVNKECLTVKETKNEADLYNSMAYDAMNICDRVYH